MLFNPSIETTSGNPFLIPLNEEEKLKVKIKVSSFVGSPKINVDLLSLEPIYLCAGAREV